MDNAMSFDIVTYFWFNCLPLAGLFTASDGAARVPCLVFYSYML